MNLSTYSVRYNQIFRQRNQLIVLLVASIGLNFILGGLSHRLAGREHIVITPPLVEEAFWIENKNVSSSYLRQMADYFSRLLLNTTGSSANARREAVLGLVESQSYSNFQHLLIDEEEKIKKNNFITLFNPVQYDIDSEKLQVRVIGDLRVFQGKEQVKESRKTYQVQYVFSGKTGKLLVSEFKDVTEKV